MVKPTYEDVVKLYNCLSCVDFKHNSYEHKTATAFINAFENSEAEGVNENYAKAKEVWGIIEDYLCEGDC